MSLSCRNSTLFYRVIEHPSTLDVTCLCRASFDPSKMYGHYVVKRERGPPSHETYARLMSGHGDDSARGGCVLITPVLLLQMGARPVLTFLVSSHARPHSILLESGRLGITVLANDSLTRPHHETSPAAPFRPRPCPRTGYTRVPMRAHRDAQGTRGNPGTWRIYKNYFVGRPT